MYRIVRRQAFSETTFLWDVSAPDVARAAQPGQFVMVRLREGGERIPLTIADFDRAAGTITLVVQAAGRTTREMMSAYAEGDTFLDFAGPLGLPQHIEKLGHVVLVGGGLGVAPVFPQLRAFREAGNRVTAVLGFRRGDLVFWEEKFRAEADQVILCTEDGSRGRAGRVTDALTDLCAADAPDRPDLVVAIGPLVMMQACVAVTRPAAVRTMVSVNTIMVDGTGMCGSCRVTVSGKVRFACVDGPDFDGHQVDFDELLARQGRFRAEEAAASTDYAHVCRVEQTLFEEGRTNYKKLRELAPLQTRMPERDPAERVRHFEEVNLGYTLRDAVAEAERCIQCARPTCVAGCPVSIDIPGFIRQVLVRDLDAALAVIHQASPFPSICGRVCPQESQCEAQCIVGKKLEPVGIGRLERYVGDHARAAAVSPRPAEQPALGRVAIVGSGPAGLAAAAELAGLGADVTVFEALHVIGGVLQYGIPAFRLPRDIIDREVSRLRAMGVRFETNKIIGRTLTVAQLQGEAGFDAVFLGVGAGAPSFLGLPGESAGQVYSANEFLTRVNLMGGDVFPLADTPVGVGQSVVVLGAGNTAMDCLRVARRLGVQTVRCVYRRSEAEAPARVEEMRHAREEGVEFLFLHAPVEIRVDAAGRVSGIVLDEMQLTEPDASGRRKPVPTGARRTLDCDTVIYALGTQPNPIVTQSTPGLALDKRGNVVADPETQATSLPGVFAGGDIVTGGATVILAMGAGRRAAAAISAFLRDRVSASQAAVEPAPAGALCPKCHQTVDDTEPYICCAGAVLQWQCRDCARVAEGFAFPHGQCPACGGVLEPREPGAVQSTAALEAVRTAFEIELGGRAFYRRAAEEATAPVMKSLFGRLATMEAEHMETLSRRYHVEPPPEDAPFFLDRAALYAGIEHDPTDPVNLFRVAIAFERRALQFFAKAAADTVFDPDHPERAVEAALYRELAAEESEHVALLETELRRFQADLPGLLAT
jgi:homotetrameric NADPH-dependent glutamate synthase